MSGTRLAARVPHVAPAANTPVSVVIPSYNVAAYLEEAIASVRAQTYPVAEIIVVDDASTDESAEIARRLGAQTLVQDRNRGPSAARNRGVHAASHEIVGFLDADDVWLPSHLEHCLAVLDQRPEIAVVSTSCELWDGTPVGRALDGTVDVPRDPVVALLEANLIEQTGVAVRRSAILEAGGYDETSRWAEDYDLWLKIAARHGIARLWVPGSRHRYHAGQLSRARLRMVENGFGVRLKHLAELREASDAERARRATDAVVRALDSDLGAMWYLNDSVAFDYVLGIARDLHGAGRTYRRWALRRKGWGPWQALRRVKRYLRPSNGATAAVN